jgi:hypothetical protein
MLGQRYKELDTELALARHRVAELLDAWEVAHRGHTVIKAANQVEFARQYNASVGSIEARRQEANEAMKNEILNEATHKAKADALRARLEAARDDVKVILQQMTNAQSVGAFAREEMKL